MSSRSSPSPKVPPGAAKQTLTAAAAVLVTLISVAWIWWTEFAAPAANDAPLNEAVGRVLAEQTARIVGRTGSIVLVLMETRHAPELQVQVDSFQKNLKLLGAIAIQDRVVLDPGNNPKYRPGSGLSAKRFLKIVRKHPGVDAIVSLIGAPRMSDAQLAELKPVPRLIAETHSPERLVNLFDRKILVAAVVPRFEFPAPGPKKPRTDQQWFDRYYQLLGPGSAIPKPDRNP
ncbi:MAG: hypothetical protein KGJ60_07440 [Verrucomicrobiota bacterium]|nr:hypothetical protein [Verrucomicrobiota bacterium]